MALLRACGVPAALYERLRREGAADGGRFRVFETGHGVDLPVAFALGHIANPNVTTLAIGLAVRRLQVVELRGETA